MARGHFEQPYHKSAAPIIGRLEGMRHPNRQFFIEAGAGLKIAGPDLARSHFEQPYHKLAYPIIQRLEKSMSR